MKSIVSTENGGKMLLESEVKVESLSELEKNVWDMQYGVYRAIGGYPEDVAYPKIVESIMYEDNNKVTLGCYDLVSREIFINRLTLTSAEMFLGVLLHEIAHAKTGAYDITKDFEDELTNMLGYISSSLLNLANNDSSVIFPAKSLDYVCAGYASCRCMSCFGTKFDHNEDLSFVKCECCGREYRGGYAELVNLNRRYMEEHDASIYIGDVLNNK